MFDEIRRLPPPPRDVRRRSRRSKDPETAAIVAILDAGDNFVYCEQRLLDFRPLFDAVAALPRTDGMIDAADPGEEVAALLWKLRRVISDCHEATAARAAFLAAVERLPKPDPEFNEDVASVKVLPPIDTDALYLILWELEAEVARREQAKRDARRKPPREATVVEVPPVVYDTSCSMCERERHFTIEGVSYCKRHVPPHLRPHGRI